MAEGGSAGMGVLQAQLGRRTRRMVFTRGWSEICMDNGGQWQKSQPPWKDSHL